MLISKNKGDPKSPGAYRPLCMLNTTGKLLEKLIKPRLTTAIQAAGDLSGRQYGFRRGLSTVHAIREIVETVNQAQQGNHATRKIVLLATLDVKNAFNSARWDDMIEALEEFRVPKYLLRILKNYLSERVLVYDTTEGPMKRTVTAGAAQGSILGPDLWNILYDGILRMDMPNGTYLSGYADDIIAVIVARDIEQIQWKLNQVMRRVTRWMEDHGLELAMEKTELVLITRKQIPTVVPMQVGSKEIQTKPAVKHLGIQIDTKLNYWGQIRQAADKAAAVTSALSRLMANVNGPRPCKRRLLMSVSESIMLYGSEIWADALKVKKYRHRMVTVQKRGVQRIISSFRTVSEPSAMVIAGVIPIELRASERKRIFETSLNIEKKTVRAEARIQTQERWQQQWEGDTRARWTAKLIPKLNVWINRNHGEVNYYLTQFLSGHGYFQAYLHKVEKTGSPECVYCGAESDSALHTFFVCDRWSEPRRRLEMEVGSITPENIVGLMLESEKKWSQVETFVEEVLKTKKKEENKRNESAEP